MHVKNENENASSAKTINGEVAKKENIMTTTTTKFNARTYRKEITALVSEMKKAELKAFAKENSIKLLRGANKEDLLKHIVDEAVKAAKAANKSGKKVDTKTTKKPRKTDKVTDKKTAKPAKSNDDDLASLLTKKEVKQALKGLDKAELIAKGKEVKAAKVSELKEMSPKELRKAIADKVVAKNKKAADKAEAKKPAKSPKKAEGKAPKADKKPKKADKKADKKAKEAKDAHIKEVNEMVEAITESIGNENRAAEILESVFTKMFKCHTASIEEDGIYYVLSDDTDMWLAASDEKLQKFINHCVKTDVVDNAIGEKPAAKKTSKLTDEAKAMIKLVNKYNKAKEAGKTKTAKKLIAEINELAGA